MVIAMKIIAVAFDEEANTDNSISVIELSGYILNPASVIFGPFVTLNQYRMLFSNLKVVCFFHLFLQYLYDSFRHSIKTTY